MIREIVLDTETTGLNARTGDRLVEIGCVELNNRVPTGVEYHCYINPERDVPAAAEAVHGISTAFLKDKPLFDAVADDFIEFVAGDTLVIHNASFDIGFLNAELERSGRPALLMDRVVDTLLLARRKHPGGPNTLDALCKRYSIDNSNRVKHGALLDSLLLAEVYIELLGIRQSTLDLAQQRSAPGTKTGKGGTTNDQNKRKRPQPLAARLSQEDEQRHMEFVKTLGNDAVWRRYITETPNELNKL